MSDPAQPYRDAIRGFVVEQLLEGRGEDLEHDSPLLELGIIDSFSIGELVAFVEQRLGVRLEDRELVPANLESVSALAALCARVAAAP